jgi:fibrillarin-like rRNA methylase
MDLKEKPKSNEDRLTFGDLSEYMMTLTEMLTILEDSNAPQKYALQVKICDEIDAILDALSIQK